MMQQYLEIKKDYTDFIVFFRLGDFYEMFFTDALLASKELEIVLTGRDAGVEERVPMCGVPYHAAHVYVEKLVEKGYKVAIVEQVEDPQLAKGIVKREVVKLVTPGTMTEEGQIDEKSNNFIACIHEGKDQYYLAYADITTGQNAVVYGPKDFDILMNEILNLNAKEIVIDSSFPERLIKPYLDQYQLTVSISDDVQIGSYYRSLVSDIYDKETLHAFGKLLNYMIQTQKKELLHLQKVQVFESNAFLRIDYNSKRNLELTETVRLQTKKGTLFWLMDHCQTAMGSRFLKQSILRPLIEKQKIEKRFSLVESFNNDFIQREDLKNQLKVVYDLERIIGRISFGNANAKDLVNLQKSLKVIPDVKRIITSLQNEYGIELISGVQDFHDIEQKIEAAIIENPPLSIKEGGFIKPGYSSLLDEIKYNQAHGKEWLEQFEQEERERTGIKKLKIGYNRVFGYFIEVTKGQLELVKEEFGYERKQTLSNSERYVTPILKQKEALILGSHEEAMKLEYELFIALREETKELIPALQKLAKVLSEIDMIYAFSYLSMTQNYTKPTIIDENRIEIIGGRHPVIEELIEKGMFVENDLTMEKEKNILLITGPNMSGKSTYMRQLALIIILTQIGCFVPCEKATLPLFDQIFTRIGASDDLSTGKSTFMVEMLEVNHALLHATDKSLILFDEIGRGTATYDGMALAQSIIEYCHHKINCKILFSTHYHELTYLEDELKGLHNVHVLAKEEKGNIVFLHKVKDGPTDKSYGIHVAKLAKLPKTLISRASQILSELEKNHGYNIIKPQTVDLFNFEDALVQEQEEEKYESIIEQLNEIEIDSLTPLNALNILADVTKEIQKKKQR